MRTDKQIQASRQNGLKSQGPTTPKGKAISSQNAIKHATFAKTILLPGESKDSFNQLLTALYSRFHPVSPLESLIVQKMAAALWRQIRLWGYEQVRITRESATIAEAQSCNSLTADALAFETLARTAGGHPTQLIELRYERQFSLALSQLKRLRAMPTADDLYDSSETNPTDA